MPPRVDQSSRLRNTPSQRKRQKESKKEDGRNGFVSLDGALGHLVRIFCSNGKTSCISSIKAKSVYLWLRGLNMGKNGHQSVRLADMLWLALQMLKSKKKEGKILSDFSPWDSWPPVTNGWPLSTWYPSSSPREVLALLGKSNHSKAMQARNCLERCLRNK